MENECARCGKEFENLYADGLYNGNIDPNFYCIDCYAVAHGRPLEITTIEES